MTMIDSLATVAGLTRAQMNSSFITTPNWANHTIVQEPAAELENPP